MDISSIHSVNSLSQEVLQDIQQVLLMEKMVRVAGEYDLDLRKSRFKPCGKTQKHKNDFSE
jgi:hypothetical protein